MRTALAFLVLAVAIAPPQARSEEPPQKRVLVLQMGRKDAPLAVAIDEAYRRRLGGGLGQRLDYYDEYVDAYRFAEPEYQLALRTYLENRYARTRFDLVIAPNTIQLRLVQDGGGTIFGDVPVVFHAGAGTTGGPRSTGVVSNVDLAGTLRLALGLHPETRHVAVVTGAAPLDVDYGNLARAQFRAFEGRVSFRYLRGLSMSELERTLAHLPTHTIVYYVSIIQDGAGAQWLPADALARIQQASPVPVYGWHEGMLGRGIVGGRLFSTLATVDATADLALRVLGGVAPGSIPVREIDPYVTAFDWQQLRRWGISEARLPAGSDVRFRPPRAWTRYRTPILAGAAAGVVMVVWWVEHRRRRRAELASSRYLQAMADLDRRATVSHFTASLAHELRQPLTAILSNADAARRMVESGSPDLPELRAILEDIRRSDKRASEIIGRIRALVQKRTRHSESIDMNAIVSETLNIAASTADATNTRLEVTLCEGPAIVSGDPIQLQQAVLNLMRNAMDAMVHTDAHDRLITVRTLRSESTVEVSVQDRGSGIPDVIAERLFEPFVTTKRDGMGMGLFIVRSIVEAHEGQTVAQNNPGGGATFRLILHR